MFGGTVLKLNTKLKKKINHLVKKTLSTTSKGLQKQTIHTPVLPTHMLTMPRYT